MFVSGAWATAAFLPIVWLLLPESVAFLDRRRAPGALEQINRILARFGHAAAKALSEARPEAERRSMADILKPGLLATTVLITFAYFAHITSFYFILKCGPKGVSCFHMMNAYEDADGRIHLDQCLSNVNAFPFIQRASGLSVAPGDTGGRLARWTINLRDGSDRVIETTIGPPRDLPVIPAARQGRPYSHGWMLTMNPEMRDPPVAGGPVGVMFNTLLRLDFTGRPPQALALPTGHCMSEPVHVPSSQPAHEGWLLTIVDQQTGVSDFRHALWILDAGNVAAGPIVRVPIAHRLRPQVHGWWVSAAELAAAA